MTHRLYHAAGIALAFLAAPALAQSPPAATPDVLSPALSPAPMGGGPLEQALPAPVPTPTQIQPVAPAAKAKLRRAPVVARETALPTNTDPTFTPEVFFATAKASERYAAISDAGGWPVVPAGVGPGSKGKGVAALRRRLAVEGDIDQAAGQGESWGPDLTVGVKKFQERMGLRQTGDINSGTLKALNIPAATRFRQLASSAQRVAGLDFPFGSRYVVVNIPSASVEAIENGRVVRRYVAIVGDADHQSPMESTRVQAINLNPTWTLPTSIIKNEIIPKMRKDPGYLSRARIRMLDNHGVEVDPRHIDWAGEKAVNYTLRQDSGASNALGLIRINMPNKDAVYMHDTPGKGAFNGDYRFLSHGCVRVEGVYDLASWLLDDTGGAPSGKWDKSALLAKIATGEHIDIKLSSPVPVVWIYMTGWAGADGVVHFRDDVYDVDKVGGGRARSASL